MTGKKVKNKEKKIQRQKKNPLSTSYNMIYDDHQYDQYGRRHSSSSAC